MGTLTIGSQFDEFYQYLSGFQIDSFYQDGKQIENDLAGSLSIKKLSTNQVAVASANDLLVINGSGITVPLGSILSGSGGSLSLNNVGGTLSEIQLWQGGSLQGSAVSGGTELLDAVLSPSSYVLSYGGNQLSVAGSNLPTDAASVAALLAGTYTGGDLAISSLTLSSGGKTLSLSLSATAYTLTAGDYKAVFTGTGLPTALTPAYLAGMLEGYSATATLGGSVTDALITQISTGSTVLSASGLSPISLDLVSGAPENLLYYALNSASAVQLGVADAPANFADFDAVAKAGTLKSITFTDAGTPTLTLTGAQAGDLSALNVISGAYNLVLNDISSRQAEALPHQHLTSYSISDYLYSLFYDADLSDFVADAKSGLLTSITLLDTSTPNIQLSPSDITLDAPLFSLIKGNFAVTLYSSATSGTITGLAGHGTTLFLATLASDGTLTPTGDGSSFTASYNYGTYHVSGVNAVEFEDFTAIVAQAPGSTNVTTGNLTELYGAVFGREPDVSGLAYYQAVLASNPAIPLTTFAQWFLASPEYSSNSAHNYASSSAGDSQFITDSYNNLLHRTPGAGDVAWYLANVLSPIEGNATPGTAAYTAAQSVAHAQLLVYFSASSEFLNDVQITAAHPASAQHWLFLV